jgi:signal transduction histidine kinase
VTIAVTARDFHHARAGSLYGRAYRLRPSTDQCDVLSRDEEHHPTGRGVRGTPPLASNDVKRLTASLEQLRLLPDLVLDGLIASIFLIGGLLDLSLPAGPDPRGFTVGGAPAYALLLSMTLPLVVRRKNPAMAFAIMTAAFALDPLLRIRDTSTEALAYGVALNAVAAVADRRTAFVAFAAAILVTVPGVDPRVLGPVPLIYNTLFLGLVFAAGRVHRLRIDVEQRLLARTRALLGARDDLARATVARERTRIAGELEASIRDSVSEMVEIASQAGSQEEDRILAATSEIERLGRNALAEMRSLLRLLRMDPPSDALPSEEDAGPDPSLDSGAPQWTLDGAVGLSLIVSVLAEFLGGQSPISGTFALAASLAIAVLAGFRRVAPVGVSALISTAVFLLHVVEGPSLPTTVLIALLVTIYTVFAERGFAPGAWVALLGIAAYTNGYPEPVLKASQILFVSTNVAFAATLGHSARERRIATEKIQQVNAEIQRSRMERARLAVAEDRTAVAREMHDLVGHEISLMVIQAGGARAILGKDPARARDAINTIRTAGRNALTEIDQLLQAIRREEDRGSVRPETLDALVDRAREAGADIEVVGEAPAVASPALRKTLYRIVQEAVTNALKHSPGAPVEVHLRSEGQTVVLEVRNGPARSKPEHGGGSGLGLLGIKERVSAFQGSCRAVPIPGGGFLVRVAIPTEQAT